VLRNVIRRTIEISQSPVHLSARLGQLILRPKTPNTPGPDVAEPLSTPQPASFPCEDIGLILVEHPQTTYTHQALVALMDHGAAVVVCGPKHLPVGLLLPLQTHTEVVWRIAEQIAAPRPLLKRLWQQIVRAKILAQARNLPADSLARRRITALAQQVRSGDPANVEAQAARAYWQTMFGQTFRRNPDAENGINASLNYGYAILRAAVARALVVAGLFPALGIHHRNRSDAFALADDLVEPLRPLVDAQVRDRLLHPQLTQGLDQTAKARLLELLTTTVRLEETTGPLMVALHRMCASLVECYQRQRKRILIPEAVN